MQKISTQELSQLSGGRSLASVGGAMPLDAYNAYLALVQAGDPAAVLSSQMGLWLQAEMHNDMYYIVLWNESDRDKYQGFMM